MDKPIQDAIAIARQAQQDINQTLGDPLHVHNRLTINGFFDRIMKRLEFMGGFLEPSEEHLPVKKFPPITNFMGKELQFAQKVTQADLNPKRAAAELLRAKVQKLWDEFIALGPQAVLRSYTNADDVMVVRGVAKWAGVKNYETNAMTVPFMEAIAAGIKAKEDLKALERRLPSDAEDEEDDELTVGDMKSSAVVLPPGDLVKNKGQEQIKGKR